MQFPSEGVTTPSPHLRQRRRRADTLDDSPAITVIANTPLQFVVNWLDGQEWVSVWNSNPFLGMFLKPQLLRDVVCLAGAWLAAVPRHRRDRVSLRLGTRPALSPCSRSRVTGCSAPSPWSINIPAWHPLFLQIYIMFFGLPMLGITSTTTCSASSSWRSTRPHTLPRSSGRASSPSPWGNTRPASSLGMNHVQTMFSIIIPQTVRPRDSHHHNPTSSRRTRTPRSSRPSVSWSS